MQTTRKDKGIPFLKAQGVVLTAYHCPAGKWTICAGLTAAKAPLQQGRASANAFVAVE